MDSMWTPYSNLSPHRLHVDYLESTWSLQVHMGECKVLPPLHPILYKVHPQPVDCGTSLTTSSTLEELTTHLIPS